MEKFAVLGGNSRLGGAFTKLFPAKSILYSKKDCDITDPNSIDKVIAKTPANYVLNCAAITDIEWCEKNQKKCFQLNTTAVKNIESICIKYGKKLIQISSDYALFPLNAYGKSKKLMEESLIKTKTLIIRTSFYYEDYKPFKKLKSGQKIQAYSDVYFNPVSIYRVAKEVFKNRDKTGIFNVFSSKKISKYDFLRLFCKEFNIDDRLVSKDSFGKIAGLPVRPRDSFVKSDTAINLKDDLKFFKKYSDF